MGIVGAGRLPSLRRLARISSAPLLAGGLVLASAAVPASAVAAPPRVPVTVPGVIVALPPGVPAPPVAAAASYVIAGLDSGQVLAAKAPHLRLPPASTLKTLTALTVAPHVRNDMVYRASRADADAEGSRVGIVAGSTYTVEDLFFGLFLRSGNDAASALANAAGGWPSTVAEMNANARRLGALDTRAVNPSGLDEPGQLSSAYDLALIGRAVLNVPELRPYPQELHYYFPGAMAMPGRSRPYFEIHTQQKFVEHYPGALGLKNGYTTLAHNTLVTAARRNGRTVMVTLLGCPGGAWKEAAALSDWAFAYAGQVEPVGRLDPPATEQPSAATGQQVPSRTTTGAPDVGPDVGPDSAAVSGPVLAATSRIPTRFPQFAANPLAGALAALLLVLLAVAAASLRRRTGTMGSSSS